jgi:protoheme IX farnesyltransferase
LKSDDYARAGVPMLPVVCGEDETRRQILLYTVLLAPVGMAPWFLGFAGMAYAVTAFAGGFGMLALAVAIYRRREGAAARKAAGRMFAFSILYLFALFAVLLVEQGVVARLF